MLSDLTTPGHPAERWHDLSSLEFVTYFAGPYSLEHPRTSHVGYPQRLTKAVTAAKDIAGMRTPCVALRLRRTDGSWIPAVDCMYRPLYTQAVALGELLGVTDPQLYMSTWRDDKHTFTPLNFHVYWSGVPTVSWEQACLYYAETFWIDRTWLKLGCQRPEGPVLRWSPRTGDPQGVCSEIRHLEWTA